MCGCVCVYVYTYVYMRVCVYVYTHYFSTCHWFGRFYFCTNLLKIQALAWLLPVNSTSKYITAAREHPSPLCEGKTAKQDSDPHVWGMLMSYVTISCMSLSEHTTCCFVVTSGHRTGKGQFSFQSQRKAMPKNAQTTSQLHSSHTLVK